jgi:hypothetical protein
MKKLFTSLLLLLSLIASSQDSLQTNVQKPLQKDTSWKTAGFFGLNASQTALSNWQGGGQNNVAINTLLNAQAEYKKGKHTWLSKIDAQYGIIKPGDVKLFRKNVDQLFALSKYNLDAWGKYWFYVAQADFRTQFAPANVYVNDTIVGNASSDFCSPAYIQLAIGLDYKPVNYFSATFAPLAGKITIVNRQYLADAGAFGVEKAVLDTAGRVTTPGKKIRYEFGGRVILKFKKDIFKNVNLDSYLDLFSNYANNPQNIDVIFNNLLTLKINKYFTANVMSQMLYDNDIITKYDWNQDGKYDNSNDIKGPRLQLITTFAVGFGYKF